MNKALIKILQSYIGATPKDKGCTNWSEMQEKMADDINKIFKRKEDIYVVISRDNGLILCTEDKEKAESTKSQQVRNEEFAGGRPSVWIQETKIK